MSLQLYEHQALAINKTVENDFQSGLYCHATGTGKTVTALGIMEKYNEKYPKNNVIWFCEKKAALVTLKDFIKKRFPKIVEKFFLIEYVTDKSSDWCQKLKALTIWGRPLLIIINRAFLTSKTRYEELTVPISLIIHDESHSAGADETFQFLDTMRSKGAKLLAFSATPLKWHGKATSRITNLYPKIISLFHFREAVTKGIIVAPRVIWMNTTNKSFERFNVASWMPILNHLWPTLPYKKTVVWTGTIESCKLAAQSFKTHQTDYPNLKDLYATVDTSETDATNYNEFARIDNNAILFCAMKHREGSDIFHLDSCIFLDGVSDRTDISFIQSLGRVLRKDPEDKKTSGLIIDATATDFTYYYNYLNRYLLDTEQMAFKSGDLESGQIRGLHYYHYDIETSELNDNNGVHYQVDQTRLDFHRSRDEAAKDNLQTLKNSGRSELTNMFKREVPLHPVYQKRLQFELNLIETNGFVYYLLQVMEILELIGDIPKVIRGSCGSSLVCYLLGITNIDPVKYKIKFVRFLSNGRKTMPDIDMDFPYYLRDSVFQKIERHWPGRVARISNHLYFRDRSSLREALRMLGYRQLIKNDELPQLLNNLTDEERETLQQHIDGLEGTFRGYSLHCGGIVIFDQGIPPELLLRSRKGNQIHYDKRDIQKHNHFKIDILSNRGLAVLTTVLPHVPIESYRVTADIYRLFAGGNNIGLTFAESRTMCKALMAIRPKSVADVAFCLAIIRPAFSDGLKDSQVTDDKEVCIHGNRVQIEESKTQYRAPAFDDDIIELIRETLNCGDEEADRVRRAFSKNDGEEIDRFWSMQANNNSKDAKYDKLVDTLPKLRKYGFCKSHAISYAQLVVGLARAKLDHPKAFWLAALNHTQSNYRNWVYWREARRAGWRLTLCQKPYYAEGDQIMGRPLATSKTSVPKSPLQQLKTYGYWKAPYFIPGCYLYLSIDKTRARFCGIIATGRTISRGGRSMSFLTIGYEDGCYLDLVVSSVTYSKYWICEGEGPIKKDKTGFCYIEPSSLSFT